MLCEVVRAARECSVLCLSSAPSKSAQESAQAAKQGTALLYVWKVQSRGPIPTITRPPSKTLICCGWSPTDCLMPVAESQWPLVRGGGKPVRLEGWAQLVCGDGALDAVSACLDDKPEGNKVDTQR